MKRFTALLCLLGLLAALPGCAQDADIPGSEVTDLIQTNGEQEPSPLGNILPEVFSLPYLPGSTLDPVTCQEGIQQTVASLICEGLFRLTPELEPQPWLCAGCHYAPDTLTYTLTLRSGITFSDGSPLTAEDVKATLDRARTSSRYAQRLSDVTDITAQGNMLTVTLSAPNTAFPALLDIPIVKAGTESLAAPIGTGPYFYSEAGGDAVLVANQQWWRGKELPVDRMALVETADEESLRYRFTSHDIQLVTADLTGTDPIIATGNIVYQDVDTTVLLYLGLNTARETLAPSGVRSALSKGLDRSFLVSAFLSGHALPAQFPVSPVSPLYPAELEQEYSLTAFSAAAGALPPLSQPLVLLVNEENSFKISLAARLASDYSAQGIPMEVQILPWADYTTALAAGSFDLYLGEIRLTADWDLAPLLGTGAPLNYGGWSDPQTDTLLAACTASSDRDAAIAQLCAHLRSRNPILPLCFKRTSVLMQSSVIDGLESTAGEPFYGIPDCTVHLKPPAEEPAADTAQD